MDTQSHSVHRRTMSARIASSFPRRCLSTRAKTAKSESAVKISHEQLARKYRNFQDVKLPGGRGLFLTADEQSEARVDRALIQSLTDRVQVARSNEMVEIIGFQSANPKFFCRGIDSSLSTSDKKDILAGIQTFNEFITLPTAKQTIVAAFDGVVLDGGFSLFEGAQYKVASQSTKLQVQALQQGHLPIGGVASSLVRKQNRNVAFARALGLSGLRLNVVDLYKYGLVSHILGEQPLNRILNTMGNTIHDLGDIKREQPPQVDIGQFDNVLDAISLQGEELAFLDEVDNEPLWDQIMAVPPKNIPLDPEIPNVAGRSWEEWQAVDAYPELLASPEGANGCFDGFDDLCQTFFGSNHSVETTFKELSNYASNLEQDYKSSELRRSQHWNMTMQRKIDFVKRCLVTLKAHKEEAKAWYHITRVAASKSLSETIKEEIAALK